MIPYWYVLINVQVSSFANGDTLETLVSQHDVKLRYLPDAAIETLREVSAQVLADYADRDATARRVYAAYQKFAKRVAGLTALADLAYFKARHDSVDGVR
jgi:TRAP-type mannitol/chloroaromatic compound transport system substrate-binding protein